MTNDSEVFPRFCSVCERQLISDSNLYCSEQCRLIDATPCKECGHFHEKPSLIGCRKHAFLYPSVFHSHSPLSSSTVLELDLSESDGGLDTTWPFTSVPSYMSE